MRVGLQSYLSDTKVDARTNNSQRQLSLAISAIPDDSSKELALNICLVVDLNDSIPEQSLLVVKQAIISTIGKLKPSDRISVIVLNRQARAIVPNQIASNLPAIAKHIGQMAIDDGSSLDEGLRLGLKEVAAHNQHCVSRIFLLTDGVNGHGDCNRCLKLAELSSECNITIDTIGFGDRWNRDFLEQISDLARGTLNYIERADLAAFELERLLNRARSVGLTNSFLTVELMPRTRLAKLKPMAQVAPETIELPVQLQGNHFTIRLGDLMLDRPRVILLNLYVNQLPPGIHKIAAVQIRYDDPETKSSSLHSDILVVELESQNIYHPQSNDTVQNHILSLAKYCQTQIAEIKLEQGDRLGAATMLQTAAKTALQLGDRSGAAVLQTNATRLQIGKNLAEGDRQKTRLISKTIF